MVRWMRDDGQIKDGWRRGFFCNKDILNKYAVEGRMNKQWCATVRQETPRCAGVRAVSQRKHGSRPPLHLSYRTSRLGTAARGRGGPVFLI